MQWLAAAAEVAINSFSDSARKKIDDFVKDEASGPRDRCKACVSRDWW
jgi:hypothetical protein